MFKVKEVLINTLEKNMDGGTVYSIFKTDKKMTLKQFRKYCWENFRCDCYCSHDCCGHAFTSSMSFKRIKRGKFSMTHSFGYNY